MSDSDESMHPPSPQAILDLALRMAEATGWDAVHLHEVAHDIGIPLSQLLRHFPDKHALAQALFDRADQSLLAAAESPGWLGREPAVRLQESLAAWFQPLSPHRRQVRQMLRYQLQPDHLHLQVQGVLRVSRTVQMWREAACLRATGLGREGQELVLTGIYLASVSAWLAGASAEADRTRRRIGWQLWVASRTTPGLAWE